MSPGTFTWAWTDLFVARIEVAVTKAALRLSELQLETESADAARWAVLQGLSAAPYDRTLWTNFLKAAAVLGTGELDRAVKHAGSVLGDDVNEFDGLIGQLRQQR